MLPAAYARLLDASCREGGGRQAANTAVRVDDDGKLHVERIEAIPGPPTLTGLRKRLEAMLPRAGLPAERTGDREDRRAGRLSLADSPSARCTPRRSAEPVGLGHPMRVAVALLFVATCLAG